ncbi:MAG: tRNA (adenosine(37)-N6)-threonylcarbamoyltransferase complex ATPase subunit type 1 TsaE [Ferruginibacter sp.]
MEISLGMDFIYSLDNIEEICIEFLKLFHDNKVFAFHGEMGAGKTTLIRNLAELMQVNEKVSSPTFSIINEYSSKKFGTIYHIDLYRLKNADEARIAGVEDCIDSNNICFVEWPERAENLMQDAIHCFITTISENVRKIVINL